MTEFGVTYEFNGGRFGDNLLSYLHAKWLSYQRKFPLYYRPFPYSSELALHEKEIHYASLRDEPRLRVYWGVPRAAILLPLLYVCPYFPEDSWERAHIPSKFGGGWISFDVDWENPEFRKIAREMVSPLQTLSLIKPPLDTLSIALHIREGGGFDMADKSDLWPLKFPPLDFYIQGLKEAVNIAQGVPLYCYLFTDALEPERLVAQIRSEIPDSQILFDYRREGNRHDENVLEDFFSLFEFDMLIHPRSNFSLIPSLLHDYLFTYSPKDFEIRDSKLVITEAYKRQK